jgi:hypothetical protein
MIPAMFRYPALAHALASVPEITHVRKSALIHVETVNSRFPKFAFHAVMSRQLCRGEPIQAVENDKGITHHL